MQVKSIRFPDTSGIGIKPSQEGTERLVHKRFNMQLITKDLRVTLVHKGNIMKFTPNLPKGHLKIGVIMLRLKISVQSSIMAGLG